ncbi:MAG: peptide deformylase [Clostridiales bacterium]|jgi:peptide deformylase|nr:peptide deformylase [Clostridiales bacterium]
MAIRNIRKEGDEILRVKCKTVREINDGIRRLIEDMFETMYATDGVGLAAPQIGIVRQIVVIDDRNGGIFTLINPKITKEEGEQESCEGCLSLPGYRGTVKRPQKVTVEALDADGNAITIEAEDFLAVIMCHEIDHLSGILYKDKAIVYEKIPQNEE